MAASGCGYDSLSLRRFRFCPGCVDEGELWSTSRAKRWFPHGGGWNPKSQSKMDEHPKMNGILTRVAQCFWAIPRMFTCRWVAQASHLSRFAQLDYKDLSWAKQPAPLRDYTISTNLGCVFIVCWLCFSHIFLVVKTRNQPKSWDISSMYVSDHPVYIIPVVSNPHVVCVWKIPL